MPTPQPDYTAGNQTTRTIYPLLCLISPNGTRYVVTIDDSGILITTPVL